MTIFLASRSYGLIPAKTEKTDTDQNRNSKATQTTALIDIQPFLTSHVTLHEDVSAVRETNLPYSLAILPGKICVTVIVTAIQQIAGTA